MGFGHAWAERDLDVDDVDAVVSNLPAILEVPAADRGIGGELHRPLNDEAAQQSGYLEARAIAAGIDAG